MIKLSRILNIIFGILDVFFFVLFLSLGLYFVLKANWILTSTIDPYEPSAVAMSSFGWFFISFGCFFLIPAGLSIIYNQKIKKATCQNDILTWAIVMVIFGYLIVGLLPLLADEDEYLAYKATIEKPSPATQNSEDISIKLKKLQDLRSQNLISKEEYENKRKDIIDHL